MDGRPTRRRFMQGAGAVGLGLLAGCGRLPWQAQPSARVWRIGYLSYGSNAAMQEPFFQAFRGGLREQGYIEGQNLVIEDRWADYQVDRLPGLLAELTRLPVDVIVGNGTPVAQVAKTLPDTPPVVMGAMGDPVRLGLVSSVAHPGGNLTGLTVATGEINAKRLQLLHETVPGIARVAVIWNAANAANLASFEPEAQWAAQILGLQFESLPVHEPEELDGALATAASRRVDALTSLPDLMLFQQRARLAEFALQSRLPTLFPEREFAQAGGLMVYGPYVPDNFRRAAAYVDKILKGGKPADLPIEQPMRFELIINLRTVQALGLTIPQHVLLQATEVIQ